MTSGSPAANARPGSLHDYLFRERAVPRFEIAPGLGVPLRFSDRRTEHLATRHAVALSDFSFMACFEIVGKDAAAFVERIQTRAVRALNPGTIAYTLLCRDDGSVMNDATLWCREGGRYTLFTGRRDDIADLRAHATHLDVTIEDVAASRAVLAVQGPSALRTLDVLLPGHPWQTLGYFRFRTVDTLGGLDIARLGYSGEAGFEVVADASVARDLWQRLLDAGAPYGIAECGFEAVDSLRIEAGSILFTRELAIAVTPYEIGLGRLVASHVATYAGAAALAARRFAEPQRLLVGFEIDDRDGQLSEDPPLAIDRTRPRGGEALLTSAARSPLFERTIGLGYVIAEDRYPGTRVTLQTGHSARVARLPFYDPAKARPRRGWTLAPSTSR